MKIATISKFFILTAILSLFVSCEDDEFLTEHPKSFNAPENTFISTKGFQTAINGLYNQVQKEYDIFVYGAFWAGTDLALNANLHGSYSPPELLGESLTSDYVCARLIWDWAYALIANSNQIIEAVSKSDVSWDSPNDPVLFEAEARFFRAYGYRALSYLFGGVPIVEEVGKPFKLDYTRQTLSEVLDFIASDLTFASDNLPEEVAEEGRIVKAAAQHLLAENYIYVGKPELAKPLLNGIVQDSKYQLMTTRFGNHTSEPGDVFSDLFMENNHNRSSGNLESIWAVQLQYDYGMGWNYFRIWIRRTWVPYYARVSGLILCDSLGGRGIGRLRPTQFWVDSYEDQDVRNSRYNLRRHYFKNDPNDPEYGQEVPITDDLRQKGSLFESTTKFNFGVTDDNVSYPFYHKDYYKIRLADTYLLLAEAQFRLGELDDAAASLNAIRNRANATPVTGADVTIDLIMDERARELFGEYPRKYALTRTETFVDRVTRYNPVTSQFVKPYNIYWPIPQTAIDANSGAVLEQNEGYK